MEKEQVIKVHQSRLIRTWENSQQFEGDIVKTYSADLIAESGRIRGTFEVQGKSYVCTSIYSSKQGVEKCEGVEVVPVQGFQEEASTNTQAGEPGAYFYFGKQVRKGKDNLRLGRKQVFIPDLSAAWAGPEEQQTFLFS